MKQATIAVLFLVVGGVAGVFIADANDSGDGSRSSHPEGAERTQNYSLQAATDRDRIADLEKQIEDLRAALAGKPTEPSAWPDDNLASIEMQLENAYAENNVDWLLEVIERLLLMGEPGFPMLRRLIEDIAFKGKFLPGSNEFRMDQIYTAGKVFTKHEREFIGFLNYLLIDKRTVPIMRQGAMMGAAFYVGSKAPGSEDLRETLIRQFLEEEGMAGTLGIPMMPKQMQQKMELMAMAMSNDPAMIPVLQDRLRNAKDEKAKGDIIGALAYLGDDSMLPSIRERLKPEGGDFRKEIDALARIDTAESHDTAAEFLGAIPNSKNFYRHATRYVRGGGGSAGVMLIQDRIKRDPSDPEVKNAIGTLSRYPTKESLDTLNLIAEGAEDDKTKDRATKAAEDVARRMSGELLAEAGKK